MHTGVGLQFTSLLMMYEGSVNKNAALRYQMGAKSLKMDLFRMRNLMSVVCPWVFQQHLKMRSWISGGRSRRLKTWSLRDVCCSAIVKMLACTVV